MFRQKSSYFFLLAILGWGGYNFGKGKRNETVTNCDQLKTIAQDRQTGFDRSQCEKLKKDNKITAILSNTLLL